jgi:hypothetical protein
VSTNQTGEAESLAAPQWAIHSAKVELPPERRWRWLLIGLRWVLPVVVSIAGLIVMCLGGESNLESGASILGVGPAIWAINWLYRAAVDGDRDRDSEDAARDYLSDHGHWPDEDPRASSPAAPSARFAR